MPLLNESVDVIAGYNSWDSIMFFDDSIREIDRCLRPGGFFVHYQDIHPAEIPLVLTEAQKRKNAGLDADGVPVLFYTEIVPAPLPGLFQKNRHIIGIDSTRFGMTRLGLYLTKHLAELFEQRGYSVERAEDVHREVTMRRERFTETLHAHGYEDDVQGNTIETRYGNAYILTDPDLPEGNFKESAWMQVLVAQKPE
jgi:SAM-dependent methyltransferase